MQATQDERLQALERAVCDLEKTLQDLREEIDQENIRIRGEITTLRREIAPPWKKPAPRSSYNAGAKR